MFRGMVLMVGLSLLVAMLAQRHEPPRQGLEALQDDDAILVGAWLGDWPTDDRPLVDDFQTRHDVDLDLVDVFIDFYTPFQNVSHTVHHIAARGAIPILSWEPHGFTTVEIAEGTRSYWLRDGTKTTVQAYLASFGAGLCQAAKETGQPIFLRTLHEMNGFWYTWGQTWEDKAGHRPNTEENYRRAWVKIHDAVKKPCPDGVRLVWATNHFSLGEGASFTGTYPGDAYVDFAAIDGYNWGGNADWGWQTFDTIFKEPYCAVARVSSKPILIAELSSTEKGGNKSQWIRETLAGFHDGKYPDVKGFVWFNDDKFEVEINGPMDWPVDSSPSAATAFAESVEAIRAETSGAGTDAAPVCGGASGPQPF
ncbi:MAG: hypothetical protein HYT80_04675 [Euryarchaeota archaeon]|nr:hypothetical protein [Euryarchaeota archaeon]